MILVLLTTVTAAYVVVIAAYGVWYGLFAKEFKRYHPWKPWKIKDRYKPNPYVRAMVVVASLYILVVAVPQLLRLWKSN